MIAHETPEIPWEKVGMDLFTVNGIDNLAVVDYYSQYIEITSLRSTTSKAVINTVKSIFARHGTSVQVISDNGPQFSSQDFKDFSKHWDFEHTTSSPHHPASNGQAEIAVKNMKNLITKVTTNHEDLYEALQVSRNTPLEKDRSSAELLFNRKIRSNLPVVKTLLKHQKHSSEVKEKKKTLNKDRRETMTKQLQLFNH